MPRRAPASMDLEEGLSLLDAYNRQLEAAGRQLSLLQALANEATAARRALEGLQREASSEVLVPLGANTFLYAEAQRKDRVLSGIGAGYTVERPVTDAAEQLAKREEELRAEMQRISEATVRLQQEAAALQESLQEGLAGANEGGRGGA